MDRDQVYHGATKAFSLAFAAIGVLLVVVTLANGGSPISIGFIMGILFVVVGFGRLWIARKFQ